MKNDVNNIVKGLLDNMFSFIAALCILATITVIGAAAINYMHELGKITEQGCPILAGITCVAATYIAYALTIKNHIDSDKSK